jgi:hypothetical protein
LTEDFAQPYRQVGYFGIWADETGDDYGKRDALAAIRGAVIDCFDEDMRTREVAAALGWLVKHGGIKEGMAKTFRQALDLTDAMARATCARATYDVMCRHLDSPDPAIAAGQRMRRMKRRPGNN